jgi:hypothetical protein
MLDLDGELRLDIFRKGVYKNLFFFKSIGSGGVHTFVA